VFYKDSLNLAPVEAPRPRAPSPQPTSGPALIDPQENDGPLKLRRARPHSGAARVFGNQR